VELESFELFKNFTYQNYDTIQRFTISLNIGDKNSTVAYIYIYVT